MLYFASSAPVQGYDMWRDTGDQGRIASRLDATFWFLLPSIPMFRLLLALGPDFWLALVAGFILIFVLYRIAAWVLARFSFQP